MQGRAPVQPGCPAQSTDGHLGSVPSPAPRQIPVPPWAFVPSSSTGTCCCSADPAWPLYPLSTEQWKVQSPAAGAGCALADKKSRGQSLLFALRNEPPADSFRTSQHGKVNSHHSAQSWRQFFFHLSKQTEFALNSPGKLLLCFFSFWYFFLSYHLNSSGLWLSPSTGIQRK